MLDWATGGRKVLANNSVRNRLALARTFLRWCDRRGIGPGLDLDEEFAVLRRGYPATYGKVQDRHPARYLDQRQAGSLIVACRDGTRQGIRDQVAIRLGLLGIRVAEICRLTWTNLRCASHARPFGTHSCHSPGYVNEISAGRGPTSSHGSDRNGRRMFIRLLADMPASPRPGCSSRSSSACGVEAPVGGAARTKRRSSVAPSGSAPRHRPTRGDTLVAPGFCGPTH